MELRHNEGPRDWQNEFAIPRFRYIEVLFHIIRYTEEFVISRFIISRFHCTLMPLTSKNIPTTKSPGVKFSGSTKPITGKKYV